MTRRAGRKPALSEEDRRLWEEVRRSVKPLASQGTKTGYVTATTAPLDAEDVFEDEAKPAALRKAIRKSTPLPSWQPPAQKTIAAKPGVLDDKTVRKLKKGRLGIDARIDLHGMAEHQAHSALNRFIDHARREDHRIVLVITGKGERSGGILRRAVPRWLAEPPLVAMVGSWRQAHVSHGGEGALYVRLRRLSGTGSAPR